MESGFTTPPVQEQNPMSPKALSRELQERWQKAQGIPPPLTDDEIDKSLADPAQPPAKKRKIFAFPSGAS